MTHLHKEIEFENDICAHLAAHDWLYAESDHTGYDRARALFPADVLAWVQATQPQAWETLTKNNGAAAEAVLFDRIRKQLDDRGTLDVLRHGVELLGLRQPVSLAQFKPALAMNTALQARYAANRLRVVRQVRYSLHNENAIDLVLFLNGIPVATVELKSDYTQSVEDAVDQYRFDRQPRPKGQPAAEPLLDFPRGALVHFAVSNSAAMMTTRLLGAATTFLPFNKGDDGAAGNPVNPNGHRTAYLWEEVWARDSWLEIIGRYIVTKRDSKKQIISSIFPRYHQLDATRKLLATVLAEGAGQKYLIQHSAGSGKTNSIAWSAHFLADLHDAQHKKLFDSVLVVSDRNVLDAQLQEAIFDFERTSGVVATIKGESASKSKELAEALSGGKKIVVCTIQTFPFALKAVQELAATQGKRFAVIADEAHSSQTGSAAANLKAVLSVEELQELADGGEVSTEDLLAAQMAARANDAGITYVAFTATPKSKTLELFGRRPNPALPAGPENLPARVPCLFDAPSHRGRIHPRRAEELHAVQPGVQARQRWQGVGRDGGGTQRGDEGHHALGAAASVQHQPESAGGGGALPRECCRRYWKAAPRRWWWWAAVSKRCAGNWLSTSTSSRRTTRSARWWRFRAR